MGGRNIARAQDPRKGLKINDRSIDAGSNIEAKTSNVNQSMISAKPPIAGNVKIGQNEVPQIKLLKKINIVKRAQSSEPKSSVSSSHNQSVVSNGSNAKKIKVLKVVNQSLSKQTGAKASNISLIKRKGSI